MNHRAISFALAAIFLAGCSFTPKTRGVAQNSDTFWSVASRRVDQEPVDIDVAAKRGDRECAKYTENLLDRDACYKTIWQVDFIKKAIYPEMAQAAVDAISRTMMLSWTGQISHTQAKYMNTRIWQEYTLARNNALYARMDSMQARESAGSSRWAEIAAGAATSIGTAAAFSQPQFTDVPPIIRQPYWMYQGGQYQDPRRDEYHMHPGVKW
jgi:hypothetical protein